MAPSKARNIGLTKRSNRTRDLIQLSLKVFDEGQLMAAFDASGEVHTYSRSKNKWIHRSCAKLYLVLYQASKVLSWRQTLFFE